MLWTLFLQVGGGGLGPNFFWSCQIWGQKFFPLFSTLDSVSARGGVWDPTFSGHAKFEVKNFSLYLVLWTLFLQGGGLGPNFFGHAKFEVKNFTLYLALWTLFLQVGGPGPNFFWSCQIWGQNFFPLFSTLDSVSAGRGGVQDPTFLVMPNLRSKIFPFIQCSGLCFHRGGGTKLFLVMPNLRSKIFPFIQCSGLCFHRGGGTKLFLVMPNFRSKIFPLFSTLDSVSTKEDPGPNFFWSCQIWGQKTFPLFSALDSVSGGGGVREPQLFLVMPNLMKFQNHILPLWSPNWKWHISLPEPILIAAEGGGLGPNFFWSCQIWGQKFFPLFSTLDSVSKGGGRGPEPNILWACQIWGQKFFLLFSALDSVSAGGSGTQPFWVMPNLRSKMFPLFSTLDSVSTGGGGGLGPNFFWSCRIWGQKFFPFVI